MRVQEPIQKNGVRGTCEDGRTIVPRRGGQRVLEEEGGPDEVIVIADIANGSDGDGRSVGRRCGALMEEGLGKVVDVNVNDAGDGQQRWRWVMGGPTEPVLHPMTQFIASTGTFCG